MIMTGVWAISQALSNFKSNFEKIGKAGKYWECESWKNYACMFPLQQTLPVFVENFHKKKKKENAYSLLLKPE